MIQSIGAVLGLIGSEDQKISRISCCYARTLLPIIFNCLRSKRDCAVPLAPDAIKALGSFAVIQNRSDKGNYH